MQHRYTHTHTSRTHTHSTRCKLRGMYSGRASCTGEWDPRQERPRPLTHLPSCELQELFCGEGARQLANQTQGIQEWVCLWGEVGVALVVVSVAMWGGGCGYGGGGWWLWVCVMCVW